MLAMICNPALISAGQSPHYSHVLILPRSEAPSLDKPTDKIIHVRPWLSYQPPAAQLPQDTKENAWHFCHVTEGNDKYISACIVNWSTKFHGNKHLRFQQSDNI